MAMHMGPAYIANYHGCPHTRGEAAETDSEAWPVPLASATAAAVKSSGWLLRLTWRLTRKVATGKPARKCSNRPRI